MNLDFVFYWKLFVRRLPVMILFLLICSSFGVITAMKLPDQWSASARLLVEEPQIPDAMVASTVATDAVEQLAIIQQKLLTRANMIDIANRLDVFENTRAMTPDKIFQEMRNSTRISRSQRRSANPETLMVISFEARSGRIAAAVVNEYVTLVLQENSKFRVSRAESTLNFFEQEVERLSADLARQSSQIALFKSENVEALPEDQNFRFSRQALLQERQARLEREITLARNQRDQILRIFESTGSLSGGGLQQRTPQQEQVIVVQAELDRAMSLYSESHPQVIRLKARLDRLQAIVDAQMASALPDDELLEGQSPQELLLQANLAEIDSRIELLEQDLVSTQEELTEVQQAIAESSANGITLNAIERDYQNIQARYNAAVNNLNNARMSERIESTAQGQRITVIENASVPQVPTGPNRTRIVVMATAVGLGLAAGFFLALELLNRTIRRPAELVSRFNITPIAVVPYIESRRQKTLRRVGIIAATGTIVVCVPLALWYIDTNYLPLEVVLQRGLDRFGLG